MEGNSFEKLPDNVKAEWQGHSNKLWVKFAETVEAGRGKKLSATAALKMEAGTFDGAAAVDNGLVDSVADPKVAFDAMVEAVNETGTWDGSVGSGFANGGVIAAKAGHLVGSGPEMVSTHPALAKVPLGSLAHPSPNLAEISADKLLPAAENIAGILDNGPGHLTRADDAHPTLETTMSNKILLTGAAAAIAGAALATPGATDPATPDNGAAATAAERERGSKITAAVSKAGLPADMATKMIADGTALGDAAMLIIDASAANKLDGGDILNIAHANTVDGMDKMKLGMEAALLKRAGMDGGEQNEFTGMTLREMARASLMQSGVVIPQGGAMALAGAAFAPSMAGGGSHTTSDFGQILANVAGKSMLRGFNESPENFEQFTTVGHLSDFKATKRVGLEAYPSLVEVADGAEFKHGTMGDFSEEIILATYGSLFALTRQTIINDDLGAFTRIPQNMGRAARRTVGDLVYALLMANAAMGDEVALFHATHKNLAASGAVPSEASINAGITALATQVGRGKAKEKLNISAKFLLANPTQRSAVLQALNSEYAPDDTAKVGTVKQSRAYNTVRDAAEPIFDARVTGNQWFLAADPTMHDTIEVAYLDGIAAPYLEQQQGWTVDGTEFKVRLDAAVAAMAWETLYKNPGQ